MVAIFLFIAIAGPTLVPYGMNEQFPEGAFQPPGLDHLFGTDNLGRDVFSRVLLGAREILLMAGFGTGISVILGAAIGLLSGYRGGWFDEVIMRSFDGLLAIPALLLALIVLGFLGPSRNGVLLVLIVIYTPIVSRVTRSVTLEIKTRPFIDAARLRGETLLWILFRELLPFTLPTLAVEAAMRFSYSIFLISSLGFLGVGAQPPSPNWGLMVKEARIHVFQTPWALYFPAGAITFVVIGVNLFADGLKRLLLSGYR